LIGNERAHMSDACHSLQRRRRVLQPRRRRGLVRLTKRTARLRDPRLHVLCEPWLADQQNAGPRALRIPAFEPDRVDAGFVRFDGDKPHRGPARITHNRAVLIEHRCSPCVPPRAGPSAPEAAGACVQDCSVNGVIPANHCAATKEKRQPRRWPHGLRAPGT